MVLWFEFKEEVGFEENSRTDGKQEGNSGQDS